MAVLAPMPIASVRSATIGIPGRETKPRTEQTASALASSTHRKGRRGVLFMLSTASGDSSVSQRRGGIAHSSAARGNVRRRDHDRHNVTALNANVGGSV